MTKVLTGMVWLMLGLPASIFAQSVFNDANDLLVVNDSTAFACFFNAPGVVTIDDANVANTASQLHLGNYIQSGFPEENTYFFAKEFRGVGTAFNLLYSHPQEIILGEYRNGRSEVVQNLQASQSVHLSKITLTWDAVSDADGYVILRGDQDGNTPHATVIGEQLTTYTDYGLGVDETYTYYVSAYSVDNAHIFYTAPMSVAGTTRPFAFSAMTDNEAEVYFDWEFDNHLLLGLPNQSAYVEIYDKTGGDSVRVYDDAIALTDITESAQLFDKSLKFRGDQTDGVSATYTGSSMSTWTIETWYNPKDTSKIMNLLDAGSISVQLDTADRIVMNTPSGTYYSSKNVVNEGDWNHLSVTYDGFTLRAYANGSLLDMGAEDGSGQAPEKSVSNLLVSQVTVGLLSNQATNTDGIYCAYNGAIGLMRVWQAARTPIQVDEDYRDVYESALDNLVGQWTFDVESTSVTDPLTSGVLNLSSSDAVSYPIRWVQSQEFVNALAQFSYTHVLAAPQYNGTRTYHIYMYKSVSGEIISDISVDVNFSYSGAPSVQIMDVAGDPHEVLISVLPVSKFVEKYKVSRTDNLTGETSVLGWAEFSNYRRGNDSVLLDTAFFTDRYAQNQSRSITANRSYSYEVRPFYNDLDFYDDQAKVTELHQTNNYGLSVTATSNGVWMRWDSTSLADDGYTHLQLSRDDEYLIKVPIGRNEYFDSLMWYGRKYRYSAHVMKENSIVFEGYDSAEVNANGMISGRLMTSAGDYVLPNRSFNLVRTNENSQLDTVGVFQTNDEGIFSVSGIYYGDRSTFEIKSISGVGVTEGVFELNWDVPALEGLRVYYDSAIENRQSLDSLSIHLTGQSMLNRLKVSWENHESVPCSKSI